ncbi:MAG: helix-turn-helix transcriptional regulator [Crocinitomicaceae bacterium]|nr:helix-turn-helix transcriptional regulator [Crocinitomicaceae bacterium]
MNVGPTIKRLRKEKGLNQTAFSLAVGITQTALSQIETGLRKPQKSTVEKICRELDIAEPLLVILSLEDSDIPEDKKKMFEMLYPTVKDLMLKIFYEDDDAPVVVE